MTGVQQPLFIVIEGLDGTGTTTLASALAEALRRRDLRVCVTAEPTEGAFGRLLRRHLAGEVNLEPTTTALVFTADRADHLDALIRPALRRGEWVISDRYVLSTLAYQGAEGVDRETILAASSGFDVPTVTFLLEAAADIRRTRISSRGPTDRYEDPDLASALEASYAASVALLRAAGHRIEVLDASAEPSEVLAAALSRLDAAS
jgi:dTMP kinase